MACDTLMRDDKLACRGKRLYLVLRTACLAQRLRKATILALYALCVWSLTFVAPEELHGLEPSFRFQNSFWVNLHATLRGEARRRSLNLTAQINVAGPDGGYTTDGPVGTAAHTVIQTSNIGYQGDAGFEMVFHEACHAEGIEQPLRTAINQEAARQNVNVARDLWARDHLLHRWRTRSP